MAVIERPSSVEAAVALVRHATDRGWRVAPLVDDSMRAVARQMRGDWEPELELDLSELAGIVEHRRADLVARVLAGTSTAELDHALAEQRQRWPASPGSAPGTIGSASLGSVLATDRRGPRGLRYGRARDWVIGTTVLRFDGALVHAGGSVVKNVSGYDLSKLYIGAWDSLGILIEASLKLDPLPEATLAIALSPIGRDAAVLLAETARAHCTSLSAALFQEAAGEGSLLLLLEGAAPVVESDGSRAQAFARERGARAVIVETTSALAAWADVEAARLAVRIEHEAAVTSKLLDSVRSFVRAPERVRSQLGCGITTLEWKTVEPEPLLAATRAVAATFGGWVAVDSVPEDAKVVAAPCLDDPVARRVSREIKRALDPAGLFPPLPIAPEPR